MSDQNSKKALVIVTDGSEEIETVVSVSVLRRAQIDVTVAGITLQNENYAKCNRGVKIVPDPISINISIFFDASSWQICRCNLCWNTPIKSANINKGGKITSHPIVKADLENEYSYQEDRVVVDNKVVTSRGPGTALLFALTIVELLLGEEKRNEVSNHMIVASIL
ncbi:unnamed protein product [Rhizophagus irregularis]|nr:unnamed protein product [Rhizophagus irregularis]